MRHLLLASLLLMSCTAFAQPGASPPPKFGPQWQALAGTWKNDGSAGAGSGICAFEFELGKCVIVRTNHAELTASGNRPGGIHDDLMVISPASAEEARATYWDNEGHVIEYTASWAADGNTLTFLSKPGPGPRFRLTYKKVDADTFTVSFDMAAPGKGDSFNTYTSGKIWRQK